MASAGHGSMHITQTYIIMSWEGRTKYAFVMAQVNLYLKYIGDTNLPVTPVYLLPQDATVISQRHGGESTSHDWGDGQQLRSC